MAAGSVRGPAQGIWSDVAVAPLTELLVRLGRTTRAAFVADRAADDVQARVAEFRAGATGEGAPRRALDLVLAACGTVAGDPAVVGTDPVASALLRGAAAALGGASDTPSDPAMSARSAASTIALAALDGAVIGEEGLIASVVVSEAVAQRLLAVLVDCGVPPVRASLPAATFAAGVAAGIASDVEDEALLRALGLLVSCVVGQGPAAGTRDARALAIGRAAGDVVLALGLARAGFAANPRALEAPRGLIDALSGQAPGPDHTAGFEASAGSRVPSGTPAANAADRTLDGPALAVDRDPVLMTLAAFVADGNVGADARHHARRALANAVGLMVGAAQADAVRIAAEVVLASPGAPEAIVPGRSGRMSAAAAAFLGGIATHYEDFDDTHLRTVAHPGAAVPPAVLALAQALDADWDATLDAVAVGIEVMLRVGDGMSPDHLDRGWHVTATTGHLGAAAGCARLLGLDAETAAHAMGLALVTATGTQTVLGTMAKPFHPGRAARDGVEAALLAARGWQAPSGALEGADGFAHAHSTDPDLALMIGELGSRWELASNAFKPYACGIVAHPSIDAGIALRALVPDPDDVATVELDVNPFTLTAMGLAEPGPGLEGKFSVHHATAVGYLVGRAGPDEFTDARVLDPAVIAIRQRIRFTPVERIARDAVDVVATARDGAVHRFSIEHATGSVDRPMTDEQLRAKAIAEMSRTLAEDAARILAGRLFADVDGAVRDVVALSTP